MNIFVPSVASEYTKLRGMPVSITGALADILDIRDADNTAFPAINLEMFDLFNVTIVNTAGDPVTDVQFQHSTDGVIWEVVDAAAITALFTGLSVGTGKSLENVNNSRSMFKIQAQTAGGGADVYVVIEGRSLV